MSILLLLLSKGINIDYKSRSIQFIMGFYCIYMAEDEDEHTDTNSAATKRQRKKKKKKRDVTKGKCTLFLSVK